MRRALAAALLLGIASVSQAQLYQAMHDAVRAAINRGLFPTPSTKPITDLGGFPSPAPKEAAKNLPPPGGDEKAIRIVRAPTIRRDGDHLTVKGGIELLARNYRITAERADGDLVTEAFSFEGDVHVAGPEAIIRGNRVLARFKERWFRVIDSNSDIKPAISKGFLLDDLYLKSHEQEGTPREVHGLEAMGTTCNYDVPHYEIRADRTTIRPGRRAIFRKASLSIKGRTILKVPYLSVPLNEPNTQYLPQVGHSPIEGNFVKSRTGLSLPSDREALDARVDEFSKLGPALGADFKYGPNERNLLSLYGLPGGPRSLLLDSHHHQSLGKLDVTFDNNYRRHDYLSDPLGTRWTSRAVASLASRAAKTRLTLNRSTSDSVGFHSVQQNLGLDDSRTYGRRFKTDLSTNWTRLDSQVVGSDLVERQRIDLKVTAQEDLDRATAEVLYQRSIPVGETSNFFNAADRTPVVRLFSDGRRLFGPRVGERFPVKAELSTGQFADPNQPNRIQRNAFEITMQKGAPTERRFKLNVDGRFRQGFYSDDTAQFVAGAGLQASYRFIKDGSVNLRYNYLRPQGFSPLSIDQTGRTDQFTGDLSFKLGHAISLGAQTGYDVLQGKLGNEAWQQVGVRAEYVPRKEFAIRTLASYDTIAHAWSNARMDFSMQRGPTFVAIGTRYDGLRHVWGAENAYIRSLRWGRVSADARIAYNGYLKKYEAQQYGLVYDLHDAEAIFQLIDNGTGLRTGKQIAIFLRLKALPFNSLFGTGGLGQPLGTGTGRDF